MKPLRPLFLLLVLLALQGRTPTPAHANPDVLRPHIMAVEPDRPSEKLLWGLGAMVEFYYPRVEALVAYRATEWFEIRGRVATNGPDWAVDVDTNWGLWGNRYFGFGLTLHGGVNAGTILAIEPDINAGVGLAVTVGSPYFRFSVRGDIWGWRYSLDPNPWTGERDLLPTWRVVLGLDWNVSDTIAMFFKADLRVGYFSDYAGALPSITLGASW